jgi:hypothetical protein
MGKTRVGVLLKEKVGKSSSNQSADLISLAQKYQVWCKKIRGLVASLEKHYQAINHIHSTRAQVRRFGSTETTMTAMHELLGPS